MTNLALLRAPVAGLTDPQLQRRLTLELAMTPMPCPGCRAAVDLLDSTGLAVDEFLDTGSAWRCPACNVSLRCRWSADGRSWRWEVVR